MFFSTRPTHCSNGFTARCHAVIVGTNGIRVQMLGLLWDLRRFRDIRQVNLLHPGDQVQHQFLQIVILTSMVFFCIPKLSCKFWFFKFFWGALGSLFEAKHSDGERLRKAAGALSMAVDMVLKTVPQSVLKDPGANKLLF